MTSLIAGFGTTAVASYGAGSNIIQVAIFIAIGLSVANGTLVGQNIGAKNINQAIKASKISAFIAFTCLSFLGIIIFIFSRQFVSFFVPNDFAVINEASNFIKTVSLSFGLVALQMCFSSVFNAAGQTKITMFITIFSQWCIQIPLAYFLSQHTTLGIQGIWLTFPITNIFNSTVAFIFYSRGSWKKTRIIEEDKTVGQVSEETIVEEGIH
jgi:Na+-driven multidrug efflux pump